MPDLPGLPDLPNPFDLWYQKWEIKHILNFCVINLTAALFTIFVLSRPCTSPFFGGKCWRIICVTIHFLLHATGFFFIITCATGYLDDHTIFGYDHRTIGRASCNYYISEIISLHKLNHLFHCTMFCYGAHFVLGLIIFSGLNVARLVTPILSTLVFVLRKAADLCCCSGPGWLAVNNYLDTILLSEEERKAEEKRKVNFEEERDEKEKVRKENKSVNLKAQVELLEMGVLNAQLEDILLPRGGIMSEEMEEKRGGKEGKGGEEEKQEECDRGADREEDKREEENATRRGEEKQEGRGEEEKKEVENDKERAEGRDESKEENETRSGEEKRGEERGGMVKRGREDEQGGADGVEGVNETRSEEAKRGEEKKGVVVKRGGEDEPQGQP